MYDRPTRTNVCVTIRVTSAWHPPTRTTNSLSKRNQKQRNAWTACAKQCRWQATPTINDYTCKRLRARNCLFLRLLIVHQSKRHWFKKLFLSFASSDARILQWFPMPRPPTNFPKPYKFRDFEMILVPPPNQRPKIKHMRWCCNHFWCTGPLTSLSKTYKGIVFTMPHPPN